MAIENFNDVKATVDVSLAVDSTGNLTMKGTINPTLLPEMTKAFLELNGKKVSDVADTVSGKLITPIAGGSSRGGKSKRNRKSRGRKSKKARKSLRRR